MLAPFTYDTDVKRLQPPSDITMVIIGLSVAAGILLALGIAVIVYLRRRKTHKEQKCEDGEIDRNSKVSTSSFRFFSQDTAHASLAN